MSIQRYDPEIQWRSGGHALPALAEADDGDVVLYVDHLAALTAERERADRAEAEVELWKERAYQLSHA